MALRHHVDNLLRRFEKEYAVHNRIEVSRSAMLHNLDVFSNRAHMPAIPVLKGNAYGHGIAQVATALKGRKDIPYIAVDGYFEALRIRQVSRQPVLIMGAIRPENYARITYDNFAFVVQHAESIHALGKTGRRIKLHLECNTGFNRYGAKPAAVAELATIIAGYRNLELEGVMAHLADADGGTTDTIQKSVALFDECVDAIRAASPNRTGPTLLHTGQSAGGFQAASRYANCFRLGIGLYGINPFPVEHRLYKEIAADLRPALRFVSTITNIIELQKGEQVSYNYTFTAPRAMRIGVAPAGYFEGVNRALSNTGVVMVQGSATPITGRVCMNHTMFSLDGSKITKNAQVGDEVIIYSNNPADPNAIDAIASQHRLFNYNLLTSLSPDVRRLLID